MRWRFVLIGVCLGLAGCGESQRSEANRLADAKLFDEATVNAVLDARAADQPAARTEGNDDDIDAPGAGNEADLRNSE